MNSVAVELRLDKDGNVLHIGRYIFKRIHGVGETFIEDRKEYRVIKSDLTCSEMGNILVEHVVELINNNFLPKPKEKKIEEKENQKPECVCGPGIARKYCPIHGYC